MANTPPRQTPLSNELLPGHTRFTVYAKYTYDEGTMHELISIEEMDVDANNMQEAIEFAAEEFARNYEPGFQLMPEHTQTRYEGQMYL